MTEQGSFRVREKRRGRRSWPGGEGDGAVLQGSVMARVSRAARGRTEVHYGEGEEARARARARARA